MSLQRASLIATVVLLGAACADEADDSGSVFSTGVGADDEAGDGVEDAGDEAEDTGEAGPALDMSEGGQGEGMMEAGDEPGCTKVDLLFVIDDSISMAGEQANLIASFPEFIAGIQDTLANADSYHVGVVTTNAYAYNAGGCQQMGALVTQTGGASASGQVCGPFAAGRYMSDADDLQATFACVAQVGIDGPTDERPMESLEIALGSAHAGAGGCNEGFLRNDALLVVVLITDEEDDHFMLYNTLEGSPGDPPDWFAAVAAAKGMESNAAILSIIGGQPGNVCPEPSGVDGAEDAPRLRAFTEMFTHGFLGDVCAPSYGPFFDEAIAVVETACEGFVPIP